MDHLLVKDCHNANPEASGRTQDAKEVPKELSTFPRSFTTTTTTTSKKGYSITWLKDTFTLNSAELSLPQGCMLSLILFKTYVHPYADNSSKLTSRCNSLEVMTNTNLLELTYVYAFTNPQLSTAMSTAILFRFWKSVVKTILDILINEDSQVGSHMKNHYKHSDRPIDFVLQQNIS